MLAQVNSPSLSSTSQIQTDLSRLQDAMKFPGIQTRFLSSISTVGCSILQRDLKNFARLKRSRFFDEGDKSLTSHTRMVNLFSTNVDVASLNEILELYPPRYLGF